MHIFSRFGAYNSKNKIGLEKEGKQLRVPVQQKEQERELLKEFLRKRIVQTSSSHWASTVIMVKKKKNGRRGSA